MAVSRNFHVPESCLIHFTYDILVVEIKDCAIRHQPFTFALISRRDWHRMGTRYHCRGIDTNGAVANAVETEQILIFPATSQQPMRVTSFVQIRGSIPLFWEQRVNIKYKPALHLSDANLDGSRVGPDTVIHTNVNDEGIFPTLSNRFLVSSNMLPHWEIIIAPRNNQTRMGSKKLILSWSI